MSRTHALLSPSSAYRWTTCTASPVAGAANTEPDEGSDAARLGTCAHQMLEDALRNPGIDLQDYLGRGCAFKGGVNYWLDEAKVSAPDHIVTVDQALIDAVSAALTYVLTQAELIGGEVNAEMRVPIGHITGEADAHGTSDVIVVAGDLLWVLDLKAGRNRVSAYDVLKPAGTDFITGESTPQEVRPNLQMVMYALGTMKALAPREFKQVRLTILQPFLSSVSEWSGTVEEVEAVGRWLSERAEATRTNPEYAPSADACHFCRAKGTCKAQTDFVVQLALEGLDDEPRPREVPPLELGQAFHLVPLVRRWCEAVEERVRQALENGEVVVRADGVGYKLVEGRKGARQWVNEKEVEAYLKTFRIGEENIYRRSLVSPADVERMAKPPRVKKGEEPKPALIGATRWNRLQELITQADGKPTVVLETDPRPALPNRLDGFDDVPPAAPHVDSDLF